MKFFVEVNDDKVAEKILTILSLFQDEGVRVEEIVEEKDKKELKERGAKQTTEFIEFLYEIYGGRENVSRLSDEEALEDALRDKYGL